MNDMMGRGSEGVSAAFSRDGRVRERTLPVPTTVGELRQQWRAFRGTGLVPSYGIDHDESGQLLFRRGEEIIDERNIPDDLPNDILVAVSFGREGEWWAPRQLGVINNYI